MSDDITASPGAAPESASPGPSQEGPRYEKVVWNGVEEEVDIETLKKHYGLEKASYKRFQEAAAKEKALQQQLAELESDDEAVFRYLQKKGKDPVKAAEKLLQEELRRQAMSPEERERESARQELRELEARREAARREIQEYKEQQEAAQYYDEYAQSIPQAIQAVGVPKELTGAVMPLVARKLEDAVVNGYEMDPKLAAAQVKQEVTTLFRSMAKSLPPAQLAALIGPEGVTALRQYELASVKQPGQRVPRDLNKPREQSGTSEQKRKKLWHEVFDD